MRILTPPSVPPFEGNSAISIAIAGKHVTGVRNQRHIGLLYKSITGRPLLLHLGWHHQLYHEEWNNKYHRTDVTQLDLELQETFADWVSIVASNESNREIPYSVIFSPYPKFDETGKYIDRKDGSGLTCATFVLAAFEAFKIPLIDSDSWPKRRAGDFTWIRKILGKLRQYITQYEFLEQFRRRHELKRFRPEDVAAAAFVFDGLPVLFEQASEIGVNLVKELPD